MRRSFFVIGVLCLLAAPGAVSACKFCCWSNPRTLRQEAQSAAIVLYGKLSNPRQGVDGNGNTTPPGVEGTTDFMIEQALRSHPLVGDRKRIEIQRYVPIDPREKNDYLLLADVHKGQIDVYRGIRTSPGMTAYLQGMLGFDSKDTEKILAHAFRHLEHPDEEIAKDAHLEFELAEYIDYRALARTLRPDLLSMWLRDPKTPAYRRGLYAFLLGQCGQDRDAALLLGICKQMLKEVDTRGGLDHCMVGLALLRPQEGWELIHSAIQDPSRDFMVRYSALRAIRLLWDSRPEVIAQKDLLDGLYRMLEQEDAADLAIEDLRRRNQWQATPRVLAVTQLKGFERISIMRRAVLRFALMSPHPEAKAYVDHVRFVDRELVRDTEEILKLEQ